MRQSCGMKEKACNRPNNHCYDADTDSVLGVNILGRRVVVCMKNSIGKKWQWENVVALSSRGGD